MSEVDAILKELKARAEAKQARDNKPKLSLRDFCFSKQFNFISDTAKRKTAVCSRRSGKTIACAADLVNDATTMEGIEVLYVTLSRKSAKRIIWKELLKLVKRYDLECKIDKTELTITFENESVIHVSGAKDSVEIEKYRGMKFYKIYLDEAQSFRAYIREFVEDILEPTLLDYDGTLCLIGTPGVVPAGYFYDMSHNIEWSNHHWTIFDNPHIERLSGKKVKDLLADVRRRRGITEDDPSYQRESLGRWVKDVDSLVYKYSISKNDFLTLPEGRYEYIFGIDIGFNDADAIAVIGYSYDHNKVFVVEEWVKSGNDITSLVEKIRELQLKYSPIKMVMDAGALGKKIQEEIQSRHHLPIEAAEKQRKVEFIALLNDDLQLGNVKARQSSNFAQDTSLVQWDYSNPEKPKEADTYHSDITDAVLYAYRECRHYLYEKPEKNYGRDTQEYMDKLEEKEAEEMQRMQEDRESYELEKAVQEDIEELSNMLDDEW